LPTGLARGDELTVITPDAQARGTVLSARSNEPTDNPAVDQTADVEAGVDDENDDLPAKPVRAPTTDGGEGRLTVGVTRTDAQPLLRASEAKVVVESRGPAGSTNSSRCFAAPTSGFVA